MVDQESTLYDAQDVLKSSQATTPTMVHLNSGNSFAPKLSIMLQENNLYHMELAGRRYDFITQTSQSCDESLYSIHVQNR